ncbi:DUF4145 domain-containing protein [Vagococcus vulneris]|uniref:DUF4145 domain-containing protein n=1 Tax=Vagococcus vulneris TaxID=1977869 RepID=A0A429ZWT8_9ENTE|nr:DUF4145 domain-containing protein [Vagococcus vulneris]RST98276.1 hypothetical protein CBF37_08165 [Vagococcus vulneris]
MPQVEVYEYDKRSNSISKTLANIEEPRICSHCKNTGIQTFVDGCITNGDYDKYSGLFIFACSFCGSNTINFMTKFSPIGGLYMANEATFRIVDTIPKNVIKSTNIPEEISSEFPDFFEIYKQSQKAEEQELDKIAGMGYRKSLEFLITDFLITYPPEGVKKEWLTDPTTTLSSKISKLEKPRIKDLSKAISFIGNDETHYSKRHPEHDTQSIKIFLDALISEIKNELTYLKAKELLNKPK